MAVSVGSMFASVQGALSGPSLDTSSTLKLLQAWQFQLFFWLSRLTLPKTVFPSFSILSSLTLDLGGKKKKKIFVSCTGPLGSLDLLADTALMRLDVYFFISFFCCGHAPSSASSPPWHALHGPTPSCLSLCPLWIFTHCVRPVPHLKNT